MFFLLCILLAVCLWGARPCLKKEELSDYLSLEYSQAVKGFFILLVFFSHFKAIPHRKKVPDTAKCDIINLWINR